ncbi:MAG: glutamate racemase [Amoebophilaceae bacterium]|jgi:glutamate racemase|nr:glutamate racemase [Amoebophilaceae bacterium]
MNRPIGIFDSGIGGLTVARAVKDLLPKEAIVYFGDTANLPYGDKDTATIQDHALRICDLLLKRQCKVILMACNSAAAAAYDLVQAYVGKRAAVLNVIDPMVNHIGSQFKGQPIGLIGTRQTVQSGIYARKIQALRLDVQLKALATPLLVPMIEASFTQGINQEIIDNYLQSPVLQHIEALILGCTHYPAIKTQIQTFYQHRLAVLDATTMTATYLRNFLVYHQLLSTYYQGQDHFVVSALTADFEKATRIFFGEAVHLEELTD